MEKTRTSGTALGLRTMPSFPTPLPLSASCAWFGFAGSGVGGESLSDESLSDDPLLEESLLSLPLLLLSESLLPLLDEALESSDDDEPA